MTGFVSHLDPLWSFAAPAVAPGAAPRSSGAFFIRGPIVWAWVRCEDGRLLRRWVGPR
jgi:hypothetical protein